MLSLARRWEGASSASLPALPTGPSGVLGLSICSGAGFHFFLLLTFMENQTFTPFDQALGCANPLPPCILHDGSGLKWLKEQADGVGAPTAPCKGDV